MKSQYPCLITFVFHCVPIGYSFLCSPEGSFPSLLAWGVPHTVQEPGIDLGFQRPLVGPFHYSKRPSPYCKEATQRHLSPQKGPSTLWLGFLLRKSQTGSVWRQEAPLCLPATWEEDSEWPHKCVMAQGQGVSYLVPMSFRAASLNVYPIAGQSFVSLQCFWLPKKHCLKPLFLFP